MLIRRFFSVWFCDVEKGGCQNYCWNQRCKAANGLNDSACVMQTVSTDYLCLRAASPIFWMATGRTRAITYLFEGLVIVGQWEVRWLLCERLELWILFRLKTKQLCSLNFSLS